MTLINYFNLLLLDSSVTTILESNNYCEPLSINSAYIIITKNDVFFRVTLNNFFSKELLYDIQDFIFNDYHIDLELNLCKN